MQLGGAIGPPVSGQMSQVLEDAVAQVLREKGDSAALFKQAMENMAAVVVKLTAIADQQQAASESLASAARSLAMRSSMPAPEVTVNVTPEVEPVINIPAPVVNMPAPTVTVMEPPEVERGVRKTVHRDSQGLITSITEEPM